MIMKGRLRTSFQVLGEFGNHTQPSWQPGTDAAAPALTHERCPGTTMERPATHLLSGLGRVWHCARRARRPITIAAAPAFLHEQCPGTDTKPNQKAYP